MAITKFTVTVEIEIETETPITEDIIETVSSEMDYNFQYSEDGVKIISTEILETSYIPQIESNE